MLWEAIILSFRQILRSGLRSALTVLGVLIGTAAVVIVVALGESARSQVAAQIENLGSNLIYVFNARGGGRSGSDQQTGRRLSAHDAEVLRREVPHLAAVTVYSSLSAQVVTSWGTASSSIVGADQDYVTVRGYDLLAGRDLRPDDISSKAKVALVGTTAASNLFGEADPVGHRLRIGRHTYEVVGTLSSKGYTPFGSDQDDRIVIPISSWHARVSPASNRQVSMVIASCPDADSVPWLHDEMDAVLRQAHKIPDDGKRDYSLLTQDQFRQTQNEIYQVLSLVLVSVAAISLFVGGVGVMNILLVSVNERKREIGTRLAVGARIGDIRMQFLTEAVALTTAGGLLGIGLAYASVSVLESKLQWPLHINFEALGAALSVSLVLGLVFGLLPAQRAARLDPIEALRHE